MLQVTIPSAEFNGNKDEMHKFIYTTFSDIKTHQNREYNNGILYFYDEENCQFICRVSENKTKYKATPLFSLDFFEVFLRCKCKRPNGDVRKNHF